MGHLGGEGSDRRAASTRKPQKVRFITYLGVQRWGRFTRGTVLSYYSTSSHNLKWTQPGFDEGATRRPIIFVKMPPGSSDLAPIDPRPRPPPYVQTGCED